MNPAPVPPPAPSPAASAPSSVQTAWPRSTQLTAAFLLGAALMLLAVHGYSYLTHGSRPSESALEPGYQVDLNRASKEELQQLPGVGDKMAERIVEHRQRRTFRSVDELTQVDGVGPATLERVRRWVCVKPVEENGPEDLKSSHEGGKGDGKKAPAAASGAKKAPLDKPVNVNEADEEQLATLPKIGAKRAKAIVEERRRGGPFKSVDDLRRVSGIGKGILEEVRPYATVGGEAPGVAKVD